MILADLVPAPLEYTAFATVVGLVVWVFRYGFPRVLGQYRDDIREQATAHRAAVQQLADNCRAELQEQGERHEREMGRRDAALEKMAAAVDRLAGAR